MKIVLTSLLALSSFFALAQEQNERPALPYLPLTNPQYQPAYRYSGAGNRTTGSTIRTVQVNIDSLGRDIIGDAGNEPSMAINPLNPNQIVIGWRQFDNIASDFRQAGWAYSSDGGLTWTFPDRIDAGVFRSDPVLDADNNGTIYYNSLSRDSAANYYCRVFRSTDGGATWDAGVDAAGGDKQWMIIDQTTLPSEGSIYSFWTSQYSFCMPDNFTSSFDRGNNYESCELVDGDQFWGTMAVGNNGEVYVVGNSRTGNGFTVSKSPDANIPASFNTWISSEVYLDGVLNFGQGFGANPGGLFGQANIDVDKSSGPGRDNVYVLGSVRRFSFQDDADVMFSRSTDGGLNWEPPVRINDDNVNSGNTQWLGTLSVAPNGRIDAVWLDTRDYTFGSDSSALYYSYSLDNGTTWTPNERLSAGFDPHVGYPIQQKMGDYFHMRSENNGAHLAWANTINGGQDVYYSYITPQFNIGINEAVTSNIHVFPNPSNGVITIKGATEKSAIDVFDSVGKKVYSTSIQKMTEQIDLSFLVNGVYFVKVGGKTFKAVIN